MHELEHVRLYLEEKGKAASLDGLELKESSRMEKGGDDVAENTLIPAAKWEISATRVNAAPVAIHGLSQGECMWRLPQVWCAMSTVTIGCCRSLWGGVKLGVCMRGRELS